MRFFSLLKLMQTLPLVSQKEETHNAKQLDPLTSMRRLRRSILRVVLILFCCFLAPIGVSPATEKEILLEFKGNVSGDPGNALVSWDQSKDPCSDYRGITCNSEGKVEKIVLSNTSLAGVLSPSLARLKSLRILSLFGNRFTGNIPQEYSELGTLWKINLSTNALSGSIPEFLGDLQNIRLLDLARNGYTGEIPAALFKNCDKTRFISLSHNSLSGSIPPSIAKCSKLEGFDFSFNNLSGVLPPAICDLQRLTYLSVRSNVLTGSVREMIAGCRSLELLDLGSNTFTGLVPFGVLGLKNISYFNVSHNGFQGDIPESIACGNGLKVLDASGNDLDGEIPPSISSCGSLRVLDLRLNRLNGSIPDKIGDLGALTVIRLGSNSIAGTIPVGFGRIELLLVLDLHNLNLVGEIPGDISNCMYLRELNLSGNALEGDIPETISNMTNLEILDLHQNRLSGSIPATLGSLSKLQILDLSHNSLSGSIPPSLENLMMLTYFNISYNSLSGAIPPMPKIQGFGLTAFFHNPRLCGDPLESCSGNRNTSASGKTKLLTVPAIVAIVAAAVILTGVCVISIMNIRARRRRKDSETVVESTPLGSSESNVIIGKLVLFSKSLPSKYEDWEAGTKALLDKDSLIGGGSIGTVYKTTFEGGISIAVKKLEFLGRIRSQDEFEHEIGRLGNLQHPNLVAFQGYYWSSTMQLILSEFVPNGNLYDNLHGLNYPGTSTGVGNSELYWSRRFQIALGTARALAYLHHDCRPPILHLNLKSSNILLDEKYEAKLSDYGLGKLLPIMDNYGLTKFHNAVGYVAPELAQSFRVSEKCDVYSFGIILLELVTGRNPVESSAGNEVVVLCEYVRGLLESSTASACFDTNLRGFSENELIQVMKLGLICTSENPLRRPSMAEVIQVLESVRSGSIS